jgi:hypothetical protein
VLTLLASALQATRGLVEEMLCSIKRLELGPVNEVVEADLGAESIAA